MAASRGAAIDSHPTGAATEPRLAPKGVVSVGSVLAGLVVVDFCTSVFAAGLLVGAAADVGEGVASASELVVASASSVVDSAGP